MLLTALDGPGQLAGVALDTLGDHPSAGFKHRRDALDEFLTDRRPGKSLNLPEFHVIEQATKTLFERVLLGKALKVAKKLAPGACRGESVELRRFALLEAVGRNAARSSELARREARRSRKAPRMSP
ncbi:MAG: hypothetical protein CFK52_08690 [Chloracidobacterium sp. CP2_5A]|nr:MAG: hypothetical protein CFK52_08690 [Chloracidobacterium sp. CP2_5A]